MSRIIFWGMSGTSDMAGIIWTEEETAVLLVFAMWGYKHEAIAEILTNRRAEVRGILDTDVLPSYMRTVSAVRNKLTDIRARNPQLWLKEEGWDRDAVLIYLYQSTVDHAQLNRLLNLTATDINILNRVCLLKNPTKSRSTD